MIYQVSQIIPLSTQAELRLFADEYLAQEFSMSILVLMNKAGGRGFIQGEVRLLTD